MHGYLIREELEEERAQEDDSQPLRVQLTLHEAHAGETQEWRVEKEKREIERERVRIRSRKF